MSRYLIPRLRDVLFVAILIAALALGQRMMNTDGDLGRHLTMGGYILETHQIPTHDLFSYTRSGDIRPAYEWLTQVIFAIAEKLAGLDGPLFLSALCIAAAFTIVQADSARRSQMPLVALGLTVLAVAASSLHWLPRPHVVTFLFLAIWLERLERVRAGECVPLWHFPTLMLLWVNAHGGFVFGILAWIAYAAGWVLEKGRDPTNRTTGRNMILIGILSLAATFITPGGWRNWQAVLSNHSQFILSRTVETMPPDVSQAGTWPFALMLLLSLLVILATRKTMPTSHIFLLVGFSVLGLAMARNIPLFAIAAAPILSRGTRDILFSAKRWQTIEANIAELEGNLHGAVWPILIGLGLAIVIGSHYQVEKKAFAHFDTRIFPVAAVDWLLEHPQTGNMFNEFNWGSYLIYRLWPGQKVFLDSQTDFYGEELVKEYDRANSAQAGWQTVFEKYKIGWAILPPSAPLTNALRGSDWNIVYEDENAIIFREPQ